MSDKHHRHSEPRTERKEETRERAAGFWARTIEVGQSTQMAAQQQKQETTQANEKRRQQT